MIFNDDTNKLLHPYYALDRMAEPTESAANTWRDEKYQNSLFSVQNVCLSLNDFDI